jgi:hypothetical protein
VQSEPTAPVDEKIRELMEKDKWRLKKHWETGEPLDGPKEKWKPDLKVVKQTIWFIQHTGRLAHNQTGQE